ncbi:ADP-ribosylglycohydrolase family protein [Serinibacter salmoneus]|uniref:ADP-ribosylglycohydrolase n=1 Tax=Serinibacter salmoneus TaxID=556530 RepID=A0A2A9CY38_9MICO|nr:ADP-ribosylglycohydrolase family protein [Serinibacter salmoneus]PFG18530.1 ADP-ribosylglycohydrolase [Serinibacter salmoneus]
MPDVAGLRVKPGELMMMHDDDHEPVGLVAWTHRGRFWRLGGFWQPVPAASAMFYGLTLQVVHEDFVAFYDVLEKTGMLPSPAQTGEYAVPDGAGRGRPARPPRRPFGWAGPAEDRVRGLVLGLLVGEAIGSTEGGGAGGSTAGGGAQGRKATASTAGLGLSAAAFPLRIAAGGQLALATIDGLVRAEASMHQALPRDQVQKVATREVIRAYRRWALRRQEAPSRGVANSGWTGQVLALRERRGSSPSTVYAIRAGKPSTSTGCQALVRSLPFAAWNRPGPEALKASCAFSHAPAAGYAAQVACEVLRVALRSDTVERAVARAHELIGNLAILAQVREAAARQVRSTERLAEMAPDASSWSALQGGVYAALSYPGPDEVLRALRFAATAPDGDSVAAVAGALLGAVHGVAALPRRLQDHLPVGWVADTLARDLVRLNTAGGMSVIAEGSASAAARLRRAYPAVIAKAVPAPGTAPATPHPPRTA